LQQHHIQLQLVLVEQNQQTVLILYLVLLLLLQAAAAVLPMQLDKVAALELAVLAIVMVRLVLEIHPLLRQAKVTMVELALLLPEVVAVAVAVQEPLVAQQAELIPELAVQEPHHLYRVRQLLMLAAVLGVQTMTLLAELLVALGAAVLLQEVELAETEQ